MFAVRDFSVCVSFTYILNFALRVKSFIYSREENLLIGKKFKIKLIEECSQNFSTKY